MLPVKDVAISYDTKHQMPGDALEDPALTQCRTIVTLAADVSERRPRLPRVWRPSQ
jgi:hypothetical protein